MNYYSRSFKTVTGMLFLLFLLSGCSSSSIKPVKPDTEQSGSVTDVPVIQTNRDMMDSGIEDKFFQKYKSMDFQIEDVSLINTRLSQSINELQYEFDLYRELYGEFPPSISTFVTSGFLFYWPRNTIDGTPVRVVTSRNLVKEQTDFGSFKYDYIDNSHFDLKWICLDGKAYKETGSKIWLEKTMDYRFSEKENTVRKIHVMMGTKAVSDVKGFNNKLIYVMCGNFTKAIARQLGTYYAYIGEFPDSYADLLFNDRFIIKENFQAFAQMLESSGADFKWGFDNEKNTLYIVLDIDGERLIAACVKYGDRLDPDGKCGMDYFDCNLDELDMSSPIITGKNLVQINIPDEYLISINDIPLSE